MGWFERVQGVLQRKAKAEPARKTSMLPSILTPYGSGVRQGQSVMKMTPANLRRFAELPVARRAINVVKDRIACDWAEGLGLTLSESVAADALLPQTASAGAAEVLANLQQLTVTSATGTALQVDAGTAAPVGGGFEVRVRDGGFGLGNAADLVLRSPVRSFSIPRVSAGERYYVRMYEGSTPPLYSRWSSAVFCELPKG